MAARQFVVPTINNITSSYGSSGTLPIVLNTPGILSVKKDFPYRVTVDVDK